MRARAEMNTNEPRPEQAGQPEPTSSRPSSEEAFADDDHVEVLVEDLFIEEYEAPLTLPTERPVREGEGRLAKAVRPVRDHARSLFGGLLAIGGLALATLLLTGRRHKPSRIARVLHTLRLARG